jgi:hypothetical protein
MNTISAQLSPRVAELLKRTRSGRGRLVFCLDATASREQTWGLAARIQAEMFSEAAKVGSLDVQLVYFRGDGEFTASPWLSDAVDLSQCMSKISCRAGSTAIRRVLQHVRAEHQREKIAAMVYVGDAVEERPSDLYDLAAGLGAPTFWFQEGNNSNVVYFDQHNELVAAGENVEQIFRQLAKLTNGAYGKFNAGAAQQLAELLRSIAVFAVGGLTALSNQRSEASRLLLQQLK